MTAEMAGMHALVLGCSSGIGLAVAHALAEQGADVTGVHFDTAVEHDRIEEQLLAMRKHGTAVTFHNVNAASSAGRATVVEALTADAGGDGVHVMLHSLAFGSLASFLGEAAITAKQMDMTMSVMAHSLVYWVQDLRRADLLKHGAKVFAMTSAGDLKVSANYGAVSAAKSALQSHVRQLALELAPAGVAVNALRAGVTVTPSLLRIPEHQDLLARARRTNPHGRLTQPEDVAQALVALSRCPSSWVTGNVIGLDGGEVLTA